MGKGQKASFCVCGSPLVYTLTCLNKSRGRIKLKKEIFLLQKKKKVIRRNEQRTGRELIQRFHFTFMSKVYVATFTPSIIGQFSLSLSLHTFSLSSNVILDHVYFPLFLYFI